MKEQKFLISKHNNKFCMHTQYEQNPNTNIIQKAESTNNR